MANPTCSAATLNDNAACYRNGILNPAQQWALLVYGQVLELEAIGGTDYTEALKTTLQIDTACPPMEDEAMLAALINIQFKNATAAGASVPDTINLKMAAAACLQYVPGGVERLKRIALLLTCKLGVHKAYVQ